MNASTGRSSRRMALRALGASVLAGSTRLVWAVTTRDAAPACGARTPDQVRSISVAEQKGKVVYLDFWASWCPPCRESFPFMNELQRDLGDRDLAIIAVSVDKSPDDARRFLAKYPPLFTVVLDPKWACASAYELPGMPTTFMLDRGGIVRAVHMGFRSDDRQRLRTELLQLLDERK